MPDSTATREPRALAQHERELVLGAFLDITGDAWAKWIIAQGGDDNIPAELHEILVEIAMSLGDIDPDTPGNPAAYQPYLQALAKLTDTNLLWLVRQVGDSPL